MVNGDECEICKIFTNPNRLKIIFALEEKPLNVTEIINETRLPQSVVSQHLSTMRLKNIVECHKNKNFMEYKLKYPEILRAFEIIQKIKEKIQKTR